MSLITASGLAKSFGAFTVFHGVSLQIPRDGRIALVGPNGVGKTTLLRILAGLDDPSAGTVHRARALRVGYLSQEAIGDARGTLWESCLEALSALREQEAELAGVERRLSQAPEDAALLEQYGELQQAFELAGGYTYPTRLQQTLSGLGFRERDYGMPLEKLSGGQQTRAQLARLLLAAPDLLILDEPTNHLDIEAVEWLEGCLREWRGAVLVVSHDRYFMDRVVTHVYELRSFGLESFRGNYTTFAQQRQIRWDDRANYIAAVKEELEHELEFVRKHIAGLLTNQAKGRLRRVSRKIRAIENHGFEGVRGKRWLEIGTSDRTMGVEEAWQKLKALAGTDHDPGRISFHLKPRRHGGNIILRAQNACIGYPGRLLFRIDELALQRGHRVAIIGGNGSGKTTLLRTMLGEVGVLSGRLQIGQGLDFGYFTQAHEDLDPSRTLIEEIQSIAADMQPPEIRHFLGRFRFSGEDHFKTISVLSGGERGRLALAKLSLSKANLLLLDEPTNHLDLPSQEVLQQMLVEYTGTILLVSHDRYLIDALATQIWAIDAEHARLVVFAGGYAAYKAWLAESAAGDVAEPSVQPAQASRAARARKPSVTASGAREQQRREELARVEETIADLEARLALTEEQLAHPPSDPQALQRLAAMHQSLRDAVVVWMTKWEGLQGDRAP